MGTVLTYAAYLLPSVPLIVGWWRLLNLQRLRKDLIVLSLASASLLWLGAAMLYHGALGPDYSRLRYVLINLNFFVLLVCAVASAAAKSPARWPAGIGSLWLAFVWGFVGAINAAV